MYVNIRIQRSLLSSLHHSRTSGLLPHSESVVCCRGLLQLCYLHTQPQPPVLCTRPVVIIQTAAKCDQARHQKTAGRTAAEAHTVWQDSALDSVPGETAYWLVYQSSDELLQIIVFVRCQQETNGLQQRPWCVFAWKAGFALSWVECAVLCPAATVASKLHG